jgi:hypothetical protein
VHNSCIFFITFSILKRLVAGTSVAKGGDDNSSSSSEAAHKSTNAVNLAAKSPLGNDALGDTLKWDLPDRPEDFTPLSPVDTKRLSPVSKRRYYSWLKAHAALCPGAASKGHPLGNQIATFEKL